MVTTEEWTGRLLDKGFAASEVALIRGFELAAIIRHARVLARGGRAVPIEAFVAGADLKLWDERIEAGFDEPMPGWETVPGTWALFLACRRDGGHS